MLSALSALPTHIRNIPDNQDCRATIRVLRALGVTVRLRRSARSAMSLSAVVRGKGLRGFKQPSAAVYVGDSGTTLRLSLGLVAGLPLTVKFTAGRSLSGRPMRRITDPLRMMGAVIRGSSRKGRPEKEEYAPLVVRGRGLRGISYRPVVASAQVKSALLLAGLHATGTTAITEPIPTRDHTERMLHLFGIDVHRRGKSVALQGPVEVHSPGDFTVPGDISSAAFFMVLGSILPQCIITLKDVSLNPSRMGVVAVLQRMGGRILVRPGQNRGLVEEPRGDIIVRSARLHATVITRKEIPSLIDEIPILMVAACFASGTTRIEHINELRLKETDRIVSMTWNLRSMGALIDTGCSGSSETVRIKGAGALSGQKVRSYGDHRTAMSMVIAGLAATGTTRLDDTRCIDKSFPGFLRIIKQLS